MSRSQPSSSPRISPPHQAREDRSGLFADAVECLHCHDEIEKRTARQVLYLVIRRVRQAYREQTSGVTRTELKERLLAIEGAILNLETALQNDDTRKALRIAGATPHELEPDLGRLKEVARKALHKLNLTGRKGSDRAAHSFAFHARPLLVLYMKRLYVAVTGEQPSCTDGRDNEFHDLLALTWEFATHTPLNSGWKRHISAADRDFVLLGDPKDPQVALSNQGPGTPAIFFSAYMDAGDLVDKFHSAVERRRDRERQSPKKAQLA